jgi:two-component system chemotaxis sensor kinase CheA
MSPKDPYKYFRIEGRELSDALGQGMLELEKTGATKELVARLLRHAHTLKGAAHVVRLTAIGNLAHSMEDALAPYREVPGAVPQESLGILSKLMDALRSFLAELETPSAPHAMPAMPASVSPAMPTAPTTPDMPAAPATSAAQGIAPRPAAPPAAAAPGTSVTPMVPKPAEPPSSPAPRLDTVRLEVGEVDALLERISEAALGLASLRDGTAALDHAHRLTHRLIERMGGDTAARLRPIAEELAAGLDRFRRSSEATLERTERELVQAHERAGRLRLSQASSMFDFLERAVRDAARALGREVRFETSGGDYRLDAPVLSALQEAMLHVVRNAVAHGLESREERIRMGKPAEGLVRVEVERHGPKIHFRCRDDGRGLDLAAVRRSAVERGLLPAGAADPLGPEEAARLLLGGGISTSERVTEVSGRGIGLDVVRETAVRLQGEVRIGGEPGLGMEVEMRVPHSLSVFPALAVEIAGTPALIPFDGVVRALQVTDKELARSPGGDTVLFEAGSLPFLALEEIFARNPERNGRSRPAVVVRAASGMAVVGVDRILGVQEAVTRPMPVLAWADPVVSGAGLDAQGDPRLILDPESMVRAARSRGGAAAAAERPPRPLILVIDDSLTTRMLEQSILESAGYEVDTAVSAEEGLSKARQKAYGFILVDVEMPGMSGFQFVETIRADAGLRHIPAILVTSRSSPEDKRRGEAAGASDYIVKGEFDQARLLARIRELAG